MRHRSIVAALGFVIATSEANARADDKERCFDAYETAQRVRQEGRLRDARQKLAVCSRESCPSAIRKDCGRWLDEVEQAIPTVILRATSASGEDLADVAVTVDGAPLATSLTGIAVPVDPGPRKFVFTRTGAAPVTVEHVIAEGDKRRLVVASFAGPSAAAPSSESAPAPAPAPAPGGDAAAPARPVPVLTYVLGGVAVAGFAGFGVFALQGASSRSDLDSCRPSCAQEDIDASKQKFLIGDVFLGIGLVALAGAVVIYLMRPATVPASAALTPRLAW